MFFPIHWILCLGISSFTWTIAQAGTQLSPDITKRSFEERYIKTLDYKHPNNMIKLIGYKRIKIPAEELTEFEDHYFKNYDEYQKSDSHFYDPASAELRVYFPVAAALLEHDGVLIEASDLGEFEIDRIEGDYAVLGRKKTDHIHGVEGNIIKDGIIYLADKAYPERKFGNIYVYDLGYKTLHHHHGLDKRAEPAKKSCIHNHGGPNCSNKFNIHMGRCPNNPKTCMDYNGFFTKCKKADRAWHFVGSDCFVSLSRGHCWNEIM